MADWRKPPRLFIPGPVMVKEDVLQQLARPTLGHRGKEYAQLHGEVLDMLKKILFTSQNVFLVTSSASGFWEASIRNCVDFNETVLATCCGAFSDKWADVARSCGRNVDELKVEWGQATTAEMIDKKLASGKYAAITLVYNETSTGLTNPLYEVSEMMKKKYPDVLVFVDAVSGMIGLPMHFDQLGWDVVFASVQKAFALPPGFTVAAVSSRAMEKSKKVPAKGLLLRLPGLRQIQREKPDADDAEHPAYLRAALPVHQTAQGRYGKRLEETQADGRLRQKLGKAEIRTVLRGEIRLQHADNRQEYKRHRRRRRHQGRAGKTPDRLRQRLRQTERADLPNRSHGRHHAGGPKGIDRLD